MAKKRRSPRIPATTIVRAPAPIVKVSVPRAATRRPRAAPVRRKRRASRKRHSGGVGGNFGGLISNETVQMAIGGALYGYAVKSGLVAKLPAVPVVGRTGTAALVLDYWSRHGGGKWAHTAARAAAAIAGYQLGAEGKIQGDATTPGSLTGDSYAEGIDYDHNE